MTDPTVAVSDASPLIALDQIGRLDLLPALFPAVMIPPAVAEEVFRGEAAPSWLRVVSPAARIVLDDSAARRLAARERLRVIGTIGLLLAGKRRGRVDAIRPLLDTLEARGFRLSSNVRATALQAAGEADSD